ncbi:YcgN family cysteine cluster protein [Sulfuricurvum sp.]|uniref:YcgN family cysteine cluster protein n=1 Tax=Sulfuricurvum sp. TaxID=2025608 RepID=UPI003568A536
MKTTDTRFWETKKLNELSHDEWEALCDGCGLCCLHKLQDDEDEHAPVLMTRVVCHCYDIKAGECSDYPNRFKKVQGCTQLTFQRAAEFDWLPETCAYRLRYHNLSLPLWHPLISGTRESVRAHGVHALNPILETDDIDLEDHIIED